MISARDIYVDKHDNITDDPDKYAAQIAVAGCHLDDKVARRYGIGDALVSPMEPDARRMVIGGRSKPSKTKTKTESDPKDAFPDATAAEPEADKATTEKPAKQAEAEKGAKTK